ncbi:MULTISPECIES: TROVE domain-containing protein [unclassified Chelatococcus]|uniref:TROVE domain-containing protein n=1 Tax=unclassified Chelatococcus TaxID=2638111 RepID=UPI0002F9A65F|nr:MULTISPECIES: TROVE domain-containing protein [unclassified Chelatococcus]ALA16118.1 TROVE domain-containing protein [Chelatococcus sp. CO-6]
MRLNARARMSPVRTHEGAPAFPHLTPIQQLRRSVLSCLLWESEFYEDGRTIAQRIEETAAKVPTSELRNLAVEARTRFNLRHVPLLLLKALVARGAGDPWTGDTVAAVIKRPDELAELLALYWKDGKRPLSAQMKRGLAKAFRKFDAYQLAKYNRDSAIKLRDVMFLVHPKPDNDRQAETWRQLVDGTLPAPDTWEVALSGGADKRETFERLLREGKLGYLALLRNLRNMAQAGVDERLVRQAILARKGADRVLPFRYIAAARAVPQWEPWIDTALLEAIGEAEPLPGKTVVLVDVSGSMNARLSAKSDLTRMDAAAALASIIRADQLAVVTFSYNVVQVPPRRGMAGIDAIIRSQNHGGTYLGQAVAAANKTPHDRLIVITDEQSHDRVPDPIARHAYMINVASNRNGVGYGGRWVHLDGFSEQVLRFIAEYERG